MTVPDAGEQQIELRPGVPFCSSAELNRIARQQGLCLAIAQAAVFDEVCQAVSLDRNLENGLIRAYLEQQGISDDEQLSGFLEQRRWNHDDLRYFATKGHRLELFKQRMFREELEIRFLERKLDFDKVEYSLLRVQDENLAFELHQRLLEGEASFAELAPNYSEGPERDSAGKIGPLPLTMAHPDVAEKLRISQPGQLWPPFFLVNIWLIVQLDQRIGAQLDDALSQELLSELFNDWLNQRVSQLLQGKTPGPIPLQLIHEIDGDGTGPLE